MIKKILIRDHRYAAPIAKHLDTVVSCILSIVSAVCGGRVDLSSIPPLKAIY